MIGDLKIPLAARKLVHNAFIHTHTPSHSTQSATLLHYTLFMRFCFVLLFPVKSIKMIFRLRQNSVIRKILKFDTQSFYMKQNTIEMSEWARDILLLFVPMMTMKWFSKLQNIFIKIDRVIEAEICILVCKSYVMYIIMCSMFESLEINCWRNILVRHIRTFAPSKDITEIRREKISYINWITMTKDCGNSIWNGRASDDAHDPHTAHVWVVSIFQLYCFQTSRIFKLTITRSKNLTESF